MPLVPPIVVDRLRQCAVLVLFLCLTRQGKTQDRHQQQIDSLQALLNGPQKNDGLSRASTLNVLGTAYMLRSDYVHAAACYSTALNIAEMLNDDTLLAYCNRDMSILDFYQHSYAHAIEFAQKAKTIFEKRHNQAMTAHCLKDIGDDYLQLADSIKAGEYYNKALPFVKAAGAPRMEAELYANQSILVLSDLRKAIALRLRAKTLWDRYPEDNVLPIINLGNLGEGYLDLVRYKLWQNMPSSDTIPHDRNKLLGMGAEYLNAAVRMAHQNGDVEDSAYFKGVLAELEEQKGDFRHAYYDFRTYQAITDSIYSQENKNKIAKIEDARELERKNQEIAAKELKIADQHKTLWLLVSFVALLGVTSGLFYQRALIRKKNNAQLSRLNAELDNANKIKNRFFGILTHDLRSPVSRLVHFLHLQEKAPGRLSAEETEEQNKKIRHSAQALLETMDSVLLWSKGQMERFQPQYSSVAVSELFREVAGLCSSDDSVTYCFRDEEKLCVTTDKDYLRSIIYNLTLNATRAVSGIPDASIIWRAARIAGATVLSITDNGPGIREKKQLAALFEETTISGSGRGLGLHIIRDLAKAIGAKIEAIPLPDRGLRFDITIDDEPKTI